MGESIRKVKVQKLTGRDKGGLLGKAKAMCAIKAKQGIHSLLPMGRQPFPGKQGSSIGIFHEEDKCHYSEHSSFFTLAFLAEHVIV